MARAVREPMNWGVLPHNGTMLKMTDLEIPDVKILEPDYFEDYRGYYSETYSARTQAKLGINTVFVQDNHSYSIKKGTIRAHHFQNNPTPQIKLVRCVRGAILDVAVDLRKGSPTYTKWVAVELTEDNHKQIWIPSGFSHGFMTLTDHCEVLYKVDEPYNGPDDRAIAFNDPDIGFDWGIDDPIISKKDMDAPLLKDSDVNFTIEDNQPTW